MKCVEELKKIIDFYKAEQIKAMNEGNTKLVLQCVMSIASLGRLLVAWEKAE